MKKIFYCVKLNQSAGRYLSAANISKHPATLTQSLFDYALFFETEDLATSAIDAYISSPNCKMSVNNRRYISVEAYEFDYDLTTFPFTNKFFIVNTEKLKASNIYRSVYLEYGNFKHFVLINVDAYKTLTKKEN